MQSAFPQATSYLVRCSRDGTSALDNEEPVVIQPALSVMPRKRLVKRALREHSQTLRRTIQFAFLLLNLWIGVQFYLFVRY